MKKYWTFSYLPSISWLYSFHPDLKSCDASDIPKTTKKSPRILFNAILRSTGSSTKMSSQIKIERNVAYVVRRCQILQQQRWRNSVENYISYIFFGFILVPCTYLTFQAVWRLEGSKIISKKCDLPWLLLNIHKLLETWFIVKQFPGNSCCARFP